MENLGYTGFLIQKTAQKNSLRKDNSNFNEFRSKNIVTYIHKKVANNKERLVGQKVSAAALSTGVNFVVLNQNIFSESKLEKVNVEKEGEEFDKECAHIMKKIQDQHYIDDFQVETNGGEDPKKNYKNRKSREDVDKKLGVLMNQAIEEKEMLSLFTDYRRAQLKEKINDIKKRKMDFSKIQQKIQNTKKVENENQDQIDFFMTEITKPNAKRNEGFTVGQILKIDEQQIHYKSKKIEEEEREQRRQGRLAMEQLNDLIQDEEEKQKKGIIKIYKQTKLDNMDGDAAKHKYKMINFKKKQEIQERLFQEMANQEKNAFHDALREKEHVDPDRFLREKINYEGPKKTVNVYKRLTKKESAPTQELINALKMNQIKEEQERRYHFSNKNKTQTDLIKAYQEMTPNKNAKNTKQQSSLINIRSSETTRPGSSRVNYNSSVPQSHGDGSQTMRPYSALTHRTNKSQHNFQQPISTNIHSRQESIHKPSNLRPQSAATSVQPKDLVDWNIDELKKRMDSYAQAPKFQSDCIKIQQILDKKNLVTKFNNLLEDCGKINVQNKKQTISMKQNLKMMEQEIKEELEQIEKTDFEKPPQYLQNQILERKGEKFAEFKRERDFKRKLIGFLIDKVEKKSDLISKYNGKKWAEDLLQQIIQKQE